MKPLAYDSAYDPYHTAFRIMRICVHDMSLQIQTPKLRILDFYLNFPFLLKRFFNDPLPRGGRKFLNQIDFESFPEPYSDLPNDQVIFKQMEVIQEAALQTLCLRGLLDKNQYDQGFMEIVSKNIPPKISAVTNRKK